jgi:hypothetical protein
MKQQVKQRSLTAIHKPVKQNPEASLSPVLVYADSREIQLQYYSEKIAYYLKALNNLNVIDNAREIVALCEEINKYKTTLRQTTMGQSKW